VEKTVSNKKAITLLLDKMQAGQVAARDLKPTTNVVHAPDERVAKFALSYLDAFGYLKEEINEWGDITIGDILSAIGQFQSMFGLKKTKTLDVKTVRAMEAPRCGCPDIVRHRHTEACGLKRAINANLPRWKKSGVTYTIADYLPSVGKTDMDSIVQSAFDAWTKSGNLNVTRSTGGTPDIVISYGRGKQSNFDGPGGTLAWAYLPNGTDSQLLCRFDLDETWVLSPNQRGILLFNVACHEFGHLLGLDHSRVQSALMAPYYNPAISVPQANDDIPRFQARYGERTSPPPPPPPGGGGGGGSNGNLVVEGQISSVTLNGRKLA
jgi:hypothetical protein